MTRGEVSFLTPGGMYRYLKLMLKNRRRQAQKPSPREEEMIVFAPSGEPRPERRMHCNRSKLRLRASLRRMTPETDR